MTGPPADERHVLALALAAADVGVDAQRAAIADVLAEGGQPSVQEVLERLVERAGARVDPAAGQAALRAVTRCGGKVALVGDADYPPRLADAWPELGAPVWVVLAGDGACVDGGRPAVAVVGTRRPTADGLATTAALAGALAEAGVTVVSGLARGIDQAAHAAALDAGGTTVAVLGTGLGVDYPRRSGALRSAIVSSGMLVTELVPGAPPRPHRFLARNRMISGLADAVVVVEGHARSGALQTARLAGAQGRDVWAVPGSLNASASAAPLALIRDGAQVVTGVDDLIGALGLLRFASPAGDEPPAEEPGGLDGRVLALLGPVPTPVDQLVELTGASVPALLAAVGRLRRDGRITDAAGGLVLSGPAPAAQRARSPAGRTSRR